MNKPELIIFTGNIGCGKSTLATVLAQRGFVIINGDSITTMVQGGDYSAYDPKKKPVYYAIEGAGIVVALCNMFSVVVDRTNMKVSDRARYIAMGKKHGAIVSSYCWGPGDPADLKRRIIDPKGVPGKQWKDVFKQMAESYEKPSQKEGFDSIYFLNIYGFRNGVEIDENTNIID